MSNPTWRTALDRLRSELMQIPRIPSVGALLALEPFPRPGEAVSDCLQTGVFNRHGEPRHKLPGSSIRQLQGVLLPVMPQVERETGRVAGYRPGERGRLAYYSSSEDTAELLLKIQTELGRLIGDAPPPVLAVMAPRTQFVQKFLLSPGDAWTLLLFDLGYPSSCESPITAERFVWHKTYSVTLRSLESYRGAGAIVHPQYSRELFDSLPPNSLPHWYSTIDDLRSASIAAIEWMLHLPTTETPPVQAAQLEADTSSRRGRPRKKDPVKDRELCEAWKRAHDAGVSKEQFCGDWPTTLKELDAALTRERERRSRRK